MKRTISLALALLLLATCVACGQKPTDSSAASQSTTNITTMQGVTDAGEGETTTTVEGNANQTTTVGGNQQKPATTVQGQKPTTARTTTRVNKVETTATTPKTTGTTANKTTLKPTTTTSKVTTTTVTQSVPQGPIAKPMQLADVDAIPIATPDMSVAELRQICLDYFRLQLSIPWTPDKSFTYQYKSAAGSITTREKDTLYAGLPYVTSTYGNLYRVMRYYDNQTGILHVEGNDQDFVNIIGNQCSVGAGWAWARVINNTTFLSTISMTQKQGCIKLGPYEYDTTMKEFNNVSTRDICRSNGEQIMYQSYAQWQPADGMVRYYNTGHVQMVSSKPNVVYDANGNIDGEKSTVKYMDQTSTTQPSLVSIQTENGTLLRQGNIDKEVSFKYLYDNNYIPFTFAEFIGQDDVEKSELTLSGYTIPTEGGVQFSKMKRGTLKCNYHISDVQLQFKDRDGKAIRTIWAPIRHEKSYTHTLAYAFSDAAITDMCNIAGATVDIVVRIGTGEKITIYSGAFTA